MKFNFWSAKTKTNTGIENFFSTKTINIVIHSVSISMLEFKFETSAWKWAIDSLTAA